MTDKVTEIYELVLTNGTRYRRGETAPYNTLKTPQGADIPVVVTGFGETGDWVEVALSNRSLVAFPEARVDHMVLLRND